MLIMKYYKYEVKSKAISITGLGDLYGCEMSRIPHCLNNWLTDGGEVVSLTCHPSTTPKEHFLVLISVRG
jgi:hypothetical protein